MWEHILRIFSVVLGIGIWEMMKWGHRQYREYVSKKMYKRYFQEQMSQYKMVRLTDDDEIHYTDGSRG